MNQNKTGKFIANLRKEKNMTQEMLAEKMGVSINAVSKWERGLCFPDISLYKKLCEELNISIEELINGEKDSSDEAKTRAIISTVKSKEKVKRKLYFVIIGSALIVISLIILSIYIYKNSENKLSRYYEKNYQKSILGRDVEALLKYRYDGEFPDYYGGLYISNNSNYLIVQIVKDKVPSKGTKDYSYFMEMLGLSDDIKIEYVNNSYNDLEQVFNIISEYMSTHKMHEDFNGVGIDIMKNKVIVNYVEATENIKSEFKKNIIDTDLVEFMSGIDYVDKNICTNYPEIIGTDILESHAETLISINVGNKQYVPVMISLYDDGTYELFTAYETCKPGKLCNSMLKYSKSVKGTYEYDLTKILEAITNSDDKSFDMNNLPIYEIYLGEKYIKKYDSLSFVVEKGKKNKYLDEFIKSIDVDLTKCAKPEYKD